MQTLSKLIKQIGQRLLELSRPFKITLAVLFLLMLVLLIYPFQITVVPAWNLQVVDDVGIPVSAIRVTEHWRHYLLEKEGHEELQLSNEAGKVSFAPRTIRASLLRRVFASLYTLTRSGTAGRTDRYGAIVAWGSPNHSVSTMTLIPEHAQPETIVVQRLR